MDIEHVVNIKSLSLRKYSAAGQPMGDAQPWCLAVSSGHQPVLSIANSNILFFKQGVPFVARTDEFEATLRHLRALASKQAYGNLEESLTVPAGRYRNTLSHYPVQHDFPQTYQIGEAGLEASADHQRVTQARQFKGYLMVFEQVLADYLAQLAHLPQLYSIESDLGQSYFSQFLTGSRLRAVLLRMNFIRMLRYFRMLRSAQVYVKIEKLFLNVVIVYWIICWQGFQKNSLTMSC